MPTTYNGVSVKLLAISSTARIIQLPPSLMGLQSFRCMGQATIGLAFGSWRKSFSFCQPGTGAPFSCAFWILLFMISLMDAGNCAFGFNGALLWLLMVTFIRCSRFAPYLAK